MVTYRRAKAVKEVMKDYQRGAITLDERDALLKKIRETERPEKVVLESRQRRA